MFINSEETYTISACDDYNLKGRGIDYIKTFKALVGIAPFLQTR